MNEKLTEEQREILNRCLWDYDFTPEEFYNVLMGSVTFDWPTQAWAVARLIDSVNWYDIKKVISPKELCARWTPEARRLVRGTWAKEGMDFACEFLHIRKYNLSTAK